MTNYSPINNNKNEAFKYDKCVLGFQTQTILGPTNMMCVFMGVQIVPLL